MREVLWVWPITQDLEEELEEEHKQESLEDEKPKEETLKGKDPEEEPLVEEDLDEDLVAKQPEPEVTRWKQGRYGGMCQGTCPMDAPGY